MAGRRYKPAVYFFVGVLFGVTLGCLLTLNYSLQSVSVDQFKRQSAIELQETVRKRHTIVEVGVNVVESQDVSEVVLYSSGNFGIFY